MQENKPVVAILMGSNSDWDVMKNAAEMLKSFDVPFEAKVVSAHRMPDEMFEYAETARDRGIRVIIAGAGGAAHLPGMLAAKTTLPVCGVPVPSRYLKGQDSLYSIVQMPKGVRRTQNLDGIKCSVSSAGLTNGKSCDRDAFRHLNDGCRFGR